MCIRDRCRTEVFANAAIFRIYNAAAYTFYGKSLPYNCLLYTSRCV